MLNYVILKFRCYRSICSDSYVIVTVNDCGDMRKNTLAARSKCMEVYFFKPKVCVLDY